MSNKSGTSPQAITLPAGGGALPGVRIISDLPSQAQGGAGALQTLVPYRREDPPPAAPILQIQGSFGN